MRHHCEALRSALEAGSVPPALDALIGIAEELIERNDKTLAVNILTLVKCYPLPNYAREIVDALFAQLEAEVGPRVLVDAQLHADDVTLDEFAAEILDELVI